MADSKITALASISTSTDPAVDPLVIVDVSDTSMAATGTTKKVTLNNLLSSSPTATGAFTVSGLVTAGSATITGDLTVDTSTLKVDSTNNRVGIGTASPATILDIQSAGGVFARIQNTTSTADAYLLAKNTVGEGFFGINATGPYIYTAGSLPITFTTATLERYRIAADGVATWPNVGGVAGNGLTLNATSNLVLRGGTAGATGVGVTFPATQVASSDANCLDDYEEGTWTPVVTSTTGTLTSVTGQSGVYTKIGRIVTVTGFFKITTNGTGSGSLSVAGLPFTNGALSNTGAGRVDGTTGNMTQVKINAATAIALISKYDNTYPAADGADFPFTISYYV
jgi:hypothetical protein